ncbi:MAG: cation-translocating P-type ATPase [Parachlamydiaceae bacterium]|nr:cation-translocating P-type ATPase [Parachlamydiaceae bacterium]
METSKPKKTDKDGIVEGLLSKSVDKLRAILLKELTQSFRSFIFAAVLTIPFLVLLFGSVFGYPIEISLTTQAVLATLVQFGPGLIFYRDAFHAMKNEMPRISILVIISTSVAYGISLIAYLNQWNLLIFFQVSTLIMTFSLLGRWLEAIINVKMVSTIDALKKLQPEHAQIEKNGILEHVNITSIKSGDICVVMPGERVPVDGVIIEGESIVNEYVLGGNSILKIPGTNIYSGTFNESGLLKIKVDKQVNQNVIMKLINLYLRSNNFYQFPQRILDYITSIYLPLILIGSMLVSFVWWAFFNLASTGIINSILIISIACPCTIVLSIPLVIWIATKVGERNGLRFNKGIAFEKTAKIKAILLDKNGGLTIGDPLVKYIQGVTKPRSEILSIAASLAIQSAHPISQAIVNKARESNINFEPSKNFERFAGRAIRGDIKDQTYFFGSLPFAEEMGMIIPDDLGPSLAIEGNLMYLEKKAKIIIAIWTPQEVIGFILIVDSLHEKVSEAILELKERGICPILLTGDQKEMSVQIASQIHIEDVKFDLLPDGKAQVVIAEKKDRITAMVGEGIYDAAAVANADVGFVFESAENIASEGADVTIFRNDFLSIVDAVDLSRAVMKKKCINFFFMFFFTFLGMALAATGNMDLSIASGTMAMTLVTVFANSLLLYYWKPKR